MGGKLGTVFARAGHEVVFSYSHHRKKLEDLAPVDAGPLQVARYAEPFTLLVAQLAHEGEGGPELAYRFERFRTKWKRCGYGVRWRSRPNGSPAIASVCRAQTHRPSRRTQVDESAASRVTGFPSTVSSSRT
jgi:hypothetical protein